MGVVAGRFRILFLAGAVMTILGLVACGGGATLAPTPTPTSTPLPTPTPTATPVPTPTPTATPTPTPMPEPEPLAFEGTGTKVSPKFELLPGLAIIEMEHSGRMNFIVELLDESGSTVDFLANDIGVFDGAIAIGVTEGALFGAKPGAHVMNIQADGNWKITIRQPRFTSATELPMSFSGQGHRVTEAFALTEGLA